MKTTCGKISSEEISRYIDLELPEERRGEVEAHLSECDRCRELAERFSLLSSSFSQYTGREVARMGAGLTGSKILEKAAGRKRWLKDFLSGVTGRGLVLKLATLTAILMISVFSFQQAPLSPAGPSAIVKSVDTDFASVMIIETQKKKHTIIWYSEG